MTAAKSVPKEAKVDFDHHSPEYRDNYAELLREMRSRCPVLHTEAHGGFWVATTYETVTKAARDHETFSSWKDIPAGSGPLLGATLPDPHPDTRQGFAEMDGPMHIAIRQKLTPYFAPAKVAEMRDEIVSYTTFAIDQFIEQGRCDLVNDLAGPVPSLLAMRTLGLPLADWRKYADAAHKAFYTVPGSDEYHALAATRAWLHEQLESTIADRRASPRDDLASVIANIELDGELLEWEDAVGTLQLVLFGGVDTTTNLLANAFLHLNSDIEARKWLAEDFSRLQGACEEYLRYFAPVQGLARTVTRPCSFGGQQLDTNDRIWLGWAAANRDPEAFDAPEEFRLDRFPNRHTSFGIGPHRCLGSAVARLLFEVVMTEVLTRMPDFTIDTARAHRYPSIGIMNGLTELPATFSVGARRGGDFSALTAGEDRE